jgi:glutamate-1-semialdehyde 2,1-aminomutase
VSDGIAQAEAETAARRLVEVVNTLADKHRVDVHLYQQSSIFHILIGARQAGMSCEPSAAVVQLFSKHPQHYATLRRALLCEGLDTHPVHGWLSTAHDAAVIERSAEAFDSAFQQLREVPGFAC